jgi:prepilin-type N-terminal cleavage/methylation domain-containing protein
MRRDAAGMTLIEVLVVVALAGVLLMLAVPSYSDANARKRVEGVAGLLHTDLQFAKSQAGASNQNVWLTTTEHGYTISSSATTYKSSDTDSKITLTSGVTITFEPYRSFPTAAASIDITHSGSSASLRVAVDALGGVRTCSANGVVQGYAAC